MTEKDSAHSVIINIRRPRSFIAKSDFTIKKQGTKKRTYDRAKTVKKPSETTLRIYSVPCDKPLHIDAFRKDDILLPYRLYAKKQENSKHKHRIKIKVQEKYKVINTDLRNRLHTDDPPDDVQAVTDVDDGYFKYLNDHPPLQHIPLYKSLKFEFHERLRMKQEIGYRQDSIFNIEDNHRRELQKYEFTVQRLMDQVKQFDECIAEDYTKSMAILKKCEALAVDLNAKVSLKENLANEQFAIQSRLIGLDYMYFMQQKYGRFLYYLSPPSWRVKHREFAHSIEIETKGFDLGTSSEEDTFNVIFENMQKECFGGLVKPVLYFSYPDDLMTVFESMEKQLLHNFIHATPLAPRAMKLKKEVQKVKTNVEQDTALVAQLIEDFEHLVDFCEKLETQLQTKFMKILDGLFYNCVAATDVLKLQMHLEFCYEKLYVEQSSNMSLVSIAKALEKMYMDYLFKLDNFTNNKIKSVMNKCIEKEKIKMRKAYIAGRELQFFSNFERALLKAHEKRNLKSVSSLPVVKKAPIRQPIHQSFKRVVSTSSQPSLTEAEIEYLYLFTDWTGSEDPADYLKSRNIVSRKKYV